MSEHIVDTRDSLTQLQELSLPPPVSWMPHTVGWAVVGGLLVLTLIYICVRIARHRRANAYRREALAELAQIEHKLLRSTPAASGWNALPALLKRTAIASTSRSAVASLTGDEWLRFLDRTLKGDAFASGPGRLLPKLAYTESLPADVSRDELRSLIDLSRRWIRHHHAHV